MFPIPHSNAFDINASLLLLWFSVLTISSIMCICKCIIHFAHSLTMLGKRQKFEYDTIILLSAKFAFSCNYDSYSILNRSTHTEIWRHIGLLIYLNFNHSFRNWIFSVLVNNVIAPACLCLLRTLMKTCFKMAMKDCRKILPLVNFVFSLWRTLFKAPYHTIIQ